MRVVAKPPINTAQHKKCERQLRSWAVGLLAWFCEIYTRLPPLLQRHPWVRAWWTQTRAKLAADLRFSGRALRHLIVAMAYARLVEPSARRRAKLYPGAERRGLRRSKRRTEFVRRVTGGVLTGLHEGALQQRAERFHAALGNLETLVARALKRLKAMFRHANGAGLIITTARDACESLAHIAAPACADTS